MLVTLAEALLINTHSDATLRRTHKLSLTDTAHMFCPCLAQQRDFQNAQQSSISSKPSRNSKGLLEKVQKDQEPKPMDTDTETQSSNAWRDGIIDVIDNSDNDWTAGQRAPKDGGCGSRTAFPAPRLRQHASQGTVHRSWEMALGLGPSCEVLENTPVAGPSVVSASGDARHMHLFARLLSSSATGWTTMPQLAEDRIRNDTVSTTDMCRRHACVDRSKCQQDTWRKLSCWTTHVQPAEVVGQHVRACRAGLALAHSETPHLRER